MSSDPRFQDNVGSHLSGEDDEEDLAANGKGLVTGRVQEDSERPAWLGSSKKYYCVNCRKQIHNTPDNENRCKARGCECKCRTHYIGKDGIARPYGTPDDSDERAKKQEPNYSPESEAEFEKIMSEFRSTKGQPTQEQKTEIVL